MKTAIIAGASGLIGSQLLNNLLENNAPGSQSVDEIENQKI